MLSAYEGGFDYTQSDVQNANSNSTIIQVKVNGKILDDKTSGNLFKHKKERDEDYRDRIKMSYYYNFCAPIIDIYTNHLFKEPILSDWGSIENVVDIRKDDIDRKKSSLIEFRKEASEWAQICGHVYALVDKPRQDGEIYSLAQQMEMGMFPYVTLFKPTDVLNWALDQFGNAYWVLVRETLDGNIDPFAFNKEKTNVDFYRLWTRDEWVLYNSQYEEVERGTHGLGFVPITIFYNKPSKKKTYLGISEIADISFIARDVYNKCSELNEIIRNQTFSILTLQGKATEYDELSVGTSKALLYPPDRNQPGYISPPAENADVLMRQIDRQVHKMFQLAKLVGGTAEQESQVQSQSGVSKAFDFQETNSTLAKKAGHMEDGELRMWQIFARWEGKDFDGSIEYPREFNIKQVNEELEEAEGLLRLQIGTEFNKQIKKEIISKKFPRLPDEEKEKMMKEVDEKEGMSAGQSIRERMPNLFNKNAIPGGINRG